MQIRRLAEGDEEAACRLIEQVKFVIEEAPDVSLDPADMGALLAHDRAYLIAAYVDDRPAWSTATASPASMGPGR